MDTIDIIRLVFCIRIWLGGIFTFILLETLKSIFVKPDKEVEYFTAISHSLNEIERADAEKTNELYKIEQ